MKAFTDPDELIDEVDDAKKHLINRTVFWPEKWKSLKVSKQIKWAWRSVRFDSSEAKKVPNDKHGIYTFVLCPDVAEHPMNHFVLYVGKAQKTTLRQRFQHYFQEMKKVKRAHICYALNKYDGYLQFCFTPIEMQTSVGDLEEMLLEALIPPFNEEFPATVSQVIKCLR